MGTKVTARPKKSGKHAIGTAGIEGMAKGAKVQKARRKKILKGFSAMWAEMRGERTKLVTRPRYDAFMLVYEQEAWLGAGYKSAKELYRALLRLPEDTPTSDTRITSEVNFAFYVRFKSPIALEVNGTTRATGTKVPTVETVQAYLDKAFPKIKATKANIDRIKAFVASVTTFAKALRASVKARRKVDVLPSGAPEVTVPEVAA